MEMTVLKKNADEKVSFQILVRATPERVYDAMATREGLNGWFTADSLIEAPDGKLFLRWENWGVEHYTGESHGKVLEARRGKRFAFKWPVDIGNYLTTVEIDFEPANEGTIVRLIEYGYEENADKLQNMLNRAGGWGEALTLMKFYVEHGLTY
ncbi:MAG: SRPBCC domain-containing protein [Acidobacteriota bacterium]